MKTPDEFLDEALAILENMESLETAINKLQEVSERVDHEPDKSACEKLMAQVEILLNLISSPSNHKIKV